MHTHRHYIKIVPNGLEIKVYVRPRSSKNSFEGPYNGALKIKLTAAPVDGEANECLREFLSKTLRIAKSSVEILAGHASRTKTVFLSGITAEQFNAAIE